MTISLKHAFSSVKADGTDSTLVQPSNWNAEHTITLAAGKVLGRDSSAAGAMQELPLSFDTSGNMAMSATGSFVPAVGTTGQRPASPVQGMVRFNTTSTKFELYNGTIWGSVGGGATISDTVPSSPSVGDLWWKSDEGQMYVYYTDANSSQWVVANAYAGGAAYLPLTGGTLTGSVTFAGAQTFDYAKLNATGTPSASNFLRGDGSWSEAGLATGEILTSIASSKTGYLLCDGAAYTRTSYATLAAAIGTPVAPVNTLGNALTGYYQYANAHKIFEANGLLFRSGTAASTTATVANGAATSTNGSTWTLRTGCNIYTYGNGNAVSYGNSVYVISTWPSANNVWQYQTTPDGVTYTARTYSIASVNQPVSCFETAYGGTSNRHVAFVLWTPSTAVSCGTQISTNVRAIYSTDGVTWTTGDTVSLTSATYNYNYGGIAGYSGGFVYFAYRNDGTNLVKHSVDGATWTDITANINSVATINSVLTGINYVNGIFILTAWNASASSNQIYTSTTGASGSWTQVVNSLTTVGNLGKIRGNANAYVSNQSFSTDLLTWVPIPNLGLGSVSIFATPSTGTRFYGTPPTGVGSYLCDIYSYTTSTQFVVPRLNTYATGARSSPYFGNSIPINYLIKT